MQSEIAQFEPGIFAAAEAAIEAARQDLGFMILNAEAFAHAPKKSIDYAVMEKTDKAALIPADIGWSDVGTWRAVWELSDRDENGNSVRGHGVVMDARNVHVRSEDTLTTVVGVDDIIVVTTQDAVLVLSHEHGDQVKQLVEQLRSENRREAGEHKRIFRPWGYYQADRRRPALSGEAHRGEAGPTAVAAEAFPPRRTLDRRARHGGGRPRRGNPSRP